MVVDNMTRENCIPIDSVKSGGDCSSLVHNIGNGAFIDSIRPIRYTWLIKVMICWVGDIQVKRGRGEVWITICIRIIVIIIHITKMSKTKTSK